MAVRHSRLGIVAALIVATLLTNAPYSTSANAQAGAACARELDRLDRDTKAFAGDLKKQNLDMISTDAVGHSLTDVKDALKGQPDQVALRKVQDLRERTQEFAKQMMSYAEVMKRIGACINGGTPHCFTDLVAQQGAEIKRWLQALSDQMAGEAAARVNNARALLENYAERASSLAIGSIARGLEACESEVQKGADANKPTVTARAKAPAGGAAAAAPAVDSGGLSGGTKLLLGVGAAAGTAAILGSQLNGLVGDGGSCSGAKPDISLCYSGAGNAPGCQPALTALEAYCNSCGKTRGRDADATNCVAK